MKDVSLYSRLRLVASRLLDYRRNGVRTVCSLLAAVLFASPAIAHGGPGIASQPVETPTWLFLLTGGGVIAVSFLLTSFVTDRGVLEAYHDRRFDIPGGSTLRNWGGMLGGVVGVVSLVVVIVVGLQGPFEANANLAVLLVWVIWWAGVTASTYLLGNSWPALDPFTRLGNVVPERDPATLPAWVGRWPAVAGLMLLVWLEVVSDVASDPTQLTAVVGLYLVATIAGSVVLGGSVWRRQVDPIWNVFRLYGKMAPIQRTETGLALAWPGAELASHDETDTAYTTPQSETGFVIALLWATSYDGFVATPGWEGLAGPLVRAGLPAELTYFGALLAGYALFLGAYWWASKLVRRVGQSYLSTATIATAFAPALVPIAAGYHLGHYLPYFLRLAPTTAVVATAPLSPPLDLPVLSLPGWFGIVGPVAVLVGHVLAVWVAHSRAFDLFTGQLQPIRSQYPYVLVMVLYTITGLWLLAQPTIQTPFL